MLFDVRVRVANALDLFSVLVRNFNIKLLFKTHDELDKVKRVSTEIRAAADEGIRAMRDRRRELDGEFALSDEIDIRDPRRSGRISQR